MKRISKTRQLTRAKKEAWKIAVKENWNNECAVCKKKENLDCHHLTYRKELKYDPLIGIVLCKKHHKLGHQSSHKGGLEFYNWFISTYPELNKKILDRIKKEC